MQKVHNRKGYALGAIVALLASLFGALPASAAATEGANIALRPQVGTTYTGLTTEDFALYAQLLEGSASSNFAEAKLSYKVTKVSGPWDVVVVSSETSSATIDIPSSSDPAGVEGTAAWIANTSASLLAGSFKSFSVSSTSGVVAAADLNGSGVSYLYLRASTGSATADVTQSADLVLSVTVFIDNQGGSANGIVDADEWHTTKTVTLKAPGNVTNNLALTTPIIGDTLVTVSSNVSSLNTANLNGTFYVGVEASSGAFGVTGGAGFSTTTISSEVTGAHLALTTVSGVVSASFVPYAASGITASMTLSAGVYYDADGSATTISSGVLLGSRVIKSSGVPTVASMDVSASTTVDLSESAGVFMARINQPVTFKLAAITDSDPIAAQAMTVTITSSANALALGSKYFTINGGAATTSWPTALAVTAGSDGYYNLTVATVNFDADDDYYITARVGNASDTMMVDVQAADYALTQPFSQYKTAAGTAATLMYEVKDQWDQVPAAADSLRLHVTKGGDASFSYTATISTVAVTNGAAEFSFLPEPATVTGSATAAVKLQKYDSSLAAWTDTADSVTTNINVSGVTDAFDSAVATSYSVSISYWPSTTAWVVVSGTVDNTGSAIVVTGAGLHFSNSAGVTYSGGITVRAGSDLAYSFGVSGQLAGTYTITMTNGSATTTSLIIVDPATSSDGAAINFNISEVVAGTTKLLVGTVVDMNGNPVDTSVGDATIAVSYTGDAGIPVGTIPTETDVDGQFKISLLTTEKDKGTFTVTAVYLKSGASTATADKITKVHAVTIGAAAATTPSADQKVNAGSFKGYVALYAKGYAGQRMSAKIGNDWVVVESLASNFERVVDFTGAGYTIAVRIYIDRVLVDTITVTTK